jgi:hypothetical protein
MVGREVSFVADSRSALEFMERTGMVQLQVPRPRLAPGALLVHSLPMQHAQLIQPVLRGYEGAPNPDRGSARPWPDQGEITGDDIH